MKKYEDVDNGIIWILITSVATKNYNDKQQQQHGQASC